MIKFKKLETKFQNEKVKMYYDILYRKRYRLMIKRFFDIVLSLILLILLSPILLIVGIWIKCDSPGPIFYRQERVTTYGKIFRIYKFRTMVINADKIGSSVTLQNDPRISKVGHKIRKLRIDEIPQLINVLKGEMSFVGTRPEVLKYVNEYDDAMYATLLMPAGITSIASIRFKDEDEIIAKHRTNNTNIDEIYLKHVLPEKMKHNLEYLNKFNLLLDLKIMIATIIKIKV